MSIWVVPIIIVVFTAISVTYSMYLQKRPISVDVLYTSDVEYKIHWMVKLLLLTEVAMSLWIIIDSMKYNIGGILFIGGIGFALLVLGFAGLYVCYKAKVRFTDDHLFYFDGFKTTEVDLKNVKNTWVANGFIVIDLGTTPRIVIPHVFSKSHEIVARLRNLCLKNSQIDSTT